MYGFEHKSNLMNQNKIGNKNKKVMFAERQN